jgi:hypothetical protein
VRVDCEKVVEGFQGWRGFDLPAVV